MADVLVINSVKQASEFYTGKSSEHPLVGVVNLEETYIPKDNVGLRVCSNLYTLALKTTACGQIGYGRQHYDFDCGVITAYAPGQTIQLNEGYQPGQLTGWALYFHPDFLHRHALSNQIRKYGYFSYDVCEALHLSEKEQDHLNQVIKAIQHELSQNIDEFSSDILLTNLELILKYTDRYYNRQFLTRKPFYKNQTERFFSLLDSSIDINSIDSQLPQVKELAEAMHMSAGYMSDMLRKETGKSAQELIHLHLIEKAKYMLLNSDESVATIAYRLGFEYPQYFSRMFKKKVHMTPKEYRNMQ